MDRLSKISQYCLGNPNALRNTFELASKAPEGDLIECGVFAGAHLAAMYYANPTKVIGFDSFEGIPHGTVKDKLQPGLGVVDKSFLNGKMETTGVSVQTKEQVEDKLKKWGVKAELIQGWFRDTVKNYEGEIALLRLDGDLYESTKTCLKHLYPKIVKGGYLIIDDMAFPGCNKAVTEYFKDLSSFTEVEGCNGVIYKQIN